MSENFRSKLKIDLDQLDYLLGQIREQLIAGNRAAAISLIVNHTMASEVSFDPRDLHVEDAGIDAHTGNRLDRLGVWSIGQLEHVSLVQLLSDRYIGPQRAMTVATIAKQHGVRMPVRHPDDRDTGNESTMATSIDAQLWP